MHRDIKPANILLDSGGRAKVADLGCAVKVVPGQLDCVDVGTPGFMAPEVARYSTLVFYAASELHQHVQLDYCSSAYIA